MGANRAQLIELARLLDSGQLRLAIDSTFTLAEAAVAFKRSLASGNHGKVVIEVADDKCSPEADSEPRRAPITPLGRE